MTGLPSSVQRLVDHKLAGDPETKKLLARLADVENCDRHQALIALADDYDGWSKEDECDSRDATLQGIRGEWNEAIADLSAAFQAFDAAIRSTPFRSPATFRETLFALRNHCAHVAEWLWREADARVSMRAWSAVSQLRERAKIYSAQSR